jgi:hypothetical protein
MLVVQNQALEELREEDGRRGAECDPIADGNRTDREVL